MSQNKEIEFKSLLLEKEYDELIDFFCLNKGSIFTQTNHYFDTLDLELKNKQSALRIRIINNRYAEMTFKKTEDDHLLETTEELTVFEAKEMIRSDQLLIPLSIINATSTIGVCPNNLNKIATLRTERIEKNIPEGLLVLDKSYYNDIIDFELELEVEEFEKGKNDFFNLLKSHKLPYRKAKNKIARAFDNSSRNTE